MRVNTRYINYQRNILKTSLRQRRVHLFHFELFFQMVMTFRSSSVREEYCIMLKIFLLCRVYICVDLKKCGMLTIVNGIRRYRCKIQDYFIISSEKLLRNYLHTFSVISLLRQKKECTVFTLHFFSLVRFDEQKWSLLLLLVVVLIFVVVVVHCYEHVRFCVVVFFMRHI